MATKIVNVKLDEKQHKLLKAYCASVHRDMQDVLREFTMMEIQKQHFCCRLVRQLMQEIEIEHDPRTRKPCAGYACFYCQHAAACAAGETEKLYIPRKDIHEMITEDAEYILDFDGSSLDPPR